MLYPSKQVSTCSKSKSSREEDEDEDDEEEEEEMALIDLTAEPKVKSDPEFLVVFNFSLTD